MTTETLRALYQRELQKLSLEISSYKNEARIWYIEKNIANTAGNLCLHLVGNLNNYIGAELGKTGYIRNRPLEFSQKNVPQKELLQMIDQTMKMVDDTLSKLTSQQLEQEYPQLVWEKKTSVEFLLTYLASHLSYHLGQINYHRRLLDE
jgi:uncharacterized damage-inducible protein DinB